MVSFLPIAEQWFLLFLFVIEIAAKIAVNRGHQLSTVQNPDLVDDISQDQRGTSLAVAGVVFAGIALLFTNDPGGYVSQVELFVTAFGFLLIAVFAHELTLTYNVVLTVQEMAFEYGLLFLLYALIRLVNGFVPSAFPVAAGVFVLVFLARFASVWGELRAHRNTTV